MKSRRPYLIRALYEWIVDSDTTPFVLVRVNSPEVIVPQDYVTDAQITLNISPSAVRDLVIGDVAMTFDGRFAGQSMSITVPLGAIGAIYARETGDGMLFEAEPATTAAQGSQDPQNRAASTATHLRVVK